MVFFTFGLCWGQFTTTLQKIMIREIITAEEGVLQIRLPAEFIGKLIEVIAFPLSDQDQVVNSVKPGPKRITVVPIGKISYKFNREDLYGR
jgi:hypothetical protein